PVVVKPDPKPPVPDPKPPMPEVKPPAPAVVKKQPVPEEAKQAENEKLIKSIYREDYAKLKPADRVALADKLVQKAKDTVDDMPARYSLLKEASTLAILGGDVA